MIDVVTYHSKNAKPVEAWLGYCVIDGEQLLVRFAAGNEADVIAKAQDWYTNEKRHQDRITGRIELEDNEVSSKAYKQPSQWDSPTTSNGGWGSSFKDMVDNIQAGDNVVVSGHGNSGKVWMVHLGERKKARVPLTEITLYEKNGWVRGGPRTQV